MLASDITSYLNSTYESSTDTTASSELDRDTFLELLCVQLQYQDPLDPLDDTEMIAQLAQFSSLEQLEAIGQDMESITALLEGQSVLNATAYLGKEVEASGSSLAKDGEAISQVTYTLEEDATSLYAYVVTSSGEIVSTVNLGETEAGAYQFQWDGLDSDGNEADDGSYAIAFAGEDASGDSIYVTTMVTGTVTQVFTEDDVTYLGLEDGRQVNVLNVSRVLEGSAAADTADATADEDA